MTVITRFAPSPTGNLHIGNVRAALICYLLAKSESGKFMLRLDDTDKERSKEEYANSIQEDLQWLGLEWDIIARQSERSKRYQEIIDKLIQDGRLYACYETPEEIEIKRKMQLSRGKPPIYDRSALQLTDAQKQQFEEEKRPKHWRFKLDHDSTISWHDIIKGETKFAAKNLSDPVLIRANGSPTYMLPSAIDDMDFGISHVVRGEDHVSNTAIQIQLFEAIGAKVPTFAHHSLMKSKSGKISKREGGFEIHSMREQGIESQAITNFMAKLGTSDAPEPSHSLKDLITNFNIDKFGKASATYEYEELVKFNSKIIHITDYNVIKNREAANNVSEAFWLSVRANLSNINQLQDWLAICEDKLIPVIDSEDMEYTKTASTLLPEGELNEDSWDIWIASIKEQTGRKGKALFMPIRKALTGREKGPEVRHLLPLISKQKIISRLNGQSA